MITPLRRRHRWLAPASFTLALVALGAALTVRPTERVREARGRAARTLGNMGPSVDGRVQSKALGAELRLLTYAGLQPPSAQGRVELEFVPRLAEGTPPLDAPDLLLYGALGTGELESLPAEATFLGPASTSEPTRFSVGPEATHVVLYSLGHARVVGALEVPRGGARR